MPTDLNLGPAPSRSPLPAIGIAALVLALIAAAVFYFNPHKTADISLSNTQTYTATTQLKASPGAVHVIGTVGSVDHDLYVATTLNITDRLRLPLFIKETTVTLTRSDGTVIDGDTINPADLPNLTTSFPALVSLAQNALPRDTQVAPSQTVSGVVLLHFSQTTDQDWKSRKSAVLTVHLFHQDDQTITIP